MTRRLLATLLVAALVPGCTLFERITHARDSPADIVSGKDYPKLVVEIDHPAGYAPNADAMRVLEATIREVASKSSIVFQTPTASIPAEPNRKYSDADLDALEANHRNARTGGDTAVLYVLYVAGGHADDTDQGRVMGQASPGGKLVIFKGNIKAATSGGLLGIDRPREDYVERAVLVHEFGHVAGLVDMGAPMTRAREDPEHAGHSTNQASVMYWQIETSQGLASILSRGADIPYQFDADDKADLKALREA